MSEVDPRRLCPNCRFPVEGDPYDIGSGPELCCPRCDTCFGFNGQRLDPTDPLKWPAEEIEKLPEWARPIFIPTET